MNKSDKKPGVMIYFDMRKSVEELSMEERGQLFTAILAYGEDKTEPDFGGNKVLPHIWIWVRHLLDRDDASYHKKVLDKQFGKYYRTAKKCGIQPMLREEWEEAGCPAFHIAHPVHPPIS